MPHNKNSAGVEQKFCGFIDSAVWTGNQTPFAQYDKNSSINYKQVDKKPRMAQIWKESDKAKVKDSRMEKLVKDKTKPAPGDYLVDKAYKNS